MEQFGPGQALPGSKSWLGPRVLYLQTSPTPAHRGQGRGQMPRPSPNPGAETRKSSFLLAVALCWALELVQRQGDPPRKKAEGGSDRAIFIVA